MKIRYLSDLHLEMTGYQPEFIDSVGEDLVVLAGDIGTGTRGIDWARNALAGREVLYVLGNHEFYQQRWDALLQYAHNSAAGSYVHVLENESIRIGGLTILGCTLWTDFSLLGASREERANTMAVCSMALNDYRLIWNDATDSLLRPQDTAKRHATSVDWLRTRLAESNEKVLIVTHHSPTPNNRNPYRQHAAPEVIAAYHSNLTALMDGDRIHAWISGHTHHSGIFAAGDSGSITIYSNQRGYPQQAATCQTPDSKFRWDRCLEIKV